MKLTKESIKHNASWKGYRLPQYDIDAVREATHKARRESKSVYIIYLSFTDNYSILKVLIRSILSGRAKGLSMFSACFLTGRQRPAKSVHDSRERVPVQTKAPSAKAGLAKPRA